MTNPRDFSCEYCKQPTDGGIDVCILCLLEMDDEGLEEAGDLADRIIDDMQILAYVKAYGLEVEDH